LHKKIQNPKTITMKLDKDKSKAAVGTIVAHLLIILVLFFMALRTPLPLPEEEGIEVDLGNSTEGMGDFQTNSPAPSQAQEQQEQEQQEQADNTKPSDNASEEIATENNEEAPSITNTPKKPDTKKDNDNNVDKPKQEEPKPTANPRALFKGGNGNGTGDQQGGSEGITGKPGDQGNPNGLAGIKNYSGTGGSGNGPSYKLGNRSHKSLSIPKKDFTEECTVTVDIWVNPEGKVVRAEAATKGTTTSSQKMKNMAIDAALKSTFSPDPEAPDEQHGTITYNFVINH